MLVSRGGGKNQHFVGTGALQQLGVVLGACLPLAAADEGEAPTGSRDCPRPVPGASAGRRCHVLLIAHGAGTYTLAGGMYLADAMEPDSASSTHMDPFFTSTGPGR